MVENRACRNGVSTWALCAERPCRGEMTLPRLSGTRGTDPIATVVAARLFPLGLSSHEAFSR